MDQTYNIFNEDATGELTRSVHSSTPGQALQGLRDQDCTRAGKRARPFSDTSRTTRSFSVPGKSARKKPRFTRTQNGVLEHWLLSNLSNPFPDLKTKEGLVQDTGLSIRQVASWFARTRQRKLERLELDAASSRSSEDVISTGQPEYQEVSGLDGCRNRNHASAFKTRGKAWSIGGHSSELRDTSALELYASSSQSCPPRLEAPLPLIAVPPTRTRTHSVNYKNSSLDVGSPSHQGSHGSTRRDTRRSWNQAELQPPTRTGLSSKEGYVEKWLELLPTDADGFCTSAGSEPLEHPPSPLASTAGATTGDKEGAIATQADSNYDLPLAPLLSFIAGETNKHNGCGQLIRSSSLIKYINATTTAMKYLSATRGPNYDELTLICRVAARKDTLRPETEHMAHIRTRLMEEASLSENDIRHVSEVLQRPSDKTPTSSVHEGPIPEPLVDHESYHTEAKPFRCRRCTGIFPTVEILQGHERLYHTFRNAIDAASSCTKRYET